MLSKIRLRRITVELRWRLGDEIMALPVYEALRRRWPHRRINVLCNYPDLLVNNPSVDEINAPPRMFDRRVCLRSGPRHVYRLEHYARLAGVPTPESRPALYYDDWAAPLLEGIRSPFVAVCAGATWPSKRWPHTHWHVLCRVLIDRGMRLVELGNSGESIGAGADADLTGKTSVHDAACILRAARLLICCDSGLMHLALAVGTPCVALFGPTEPHILVRNEPLLHAIRGKTPCGGCWNTSMEMQEPGVCPRGEPNCMQSITVEEVLDKAINAVKF